MMLRVFLVRIQNDVDTFVPPLFLAIPMFEESFYTTPICFCHFLIMTPVYEWQLVDLYSIWEAVVFQESTTFLNKLNVGAGPNCQVLWLQRGYVIS